MISYSSSSESSVRNGQEPLISQLHKAFFSKLYEISKNKQRSENLHFYHLMVKSLFFLFVFVAVVVVIIVTIKPDVYQRTFEVFKLVVINSGTVNTERNGKRRILLFRYTLTTIIYSPCGNHGRESITQKSKTIISSITSGILEDSKRNADM